MKKVTAAICVKDNKILIAKRGKNETLSGKWEFPGGKIEEGETPEDCLKREIKEELNLKIIVGEYFDRSIYEYENGVIELLAYDCEIIGGDMKLSVHDEIQWVDYNVIDAFDFLPADIPLVEKIKEKYNCKTDTR
jgi:8-oxo-dGTP diphosphatase